MERFFAPLDYTKLEIDEKLGIKEPSIFEALIFDLEIDLEDMKDIDTDLYYKLSQSIIIQKEFYLIKKYNDYYEITIINNKKYISSIEDKMTKCKCEKKYKKYEKEINNAKRGFITRFRKHQQHVKKLEILKEEYDKLCAEIESALY